MTRISVRNCIKYFCLKLYLMTHAFDIERGETSVLRRKTILVSTVILLHSADTFKKDCCQLQAKVCARITG